MKDAPENILADTRVLSRKEKHAAYMREYSRKNSVRLNAAQRARYSPEKRKAWVEKNKDILRKQRKSRRPFHLAKLRAESLAHYYANKEKYCERSRLASRIRKARIKGNGEIERFAAKEIFERDNWTCHLCGKPVDPTLKNPNRERASLDHVKPISKGGTHTRSNVACSHLSCNLTKRHFYEKCPNAAI